MPKQLDISKEDTALENKNAKKTKGILAAVIIFAELIMIYIVQNISSNVKGTVMVAFLIIGFLFIFVLMSYWLLKIKK